jgi:hypothetical protein
MAAHRDPCLPAIRGFRDLLVDALIAEFTRQPVVPNPKPTPAPAAANDVDLEGAA